MRKELGTWATGDIERVVHAIHATGGVTARNLLEGRPRRVLAVLAGSGNAARLDVDMQI